MNNLSSNQIRQTFLDFFKSKGHSILPSASLLPEDKTVLFITAGMQPLVPHLLGKAHPEGKRLANAQKCLRTDDILEVGDNRHNTFFEMLGNWSLGDPFSPDGVGQAGYFKKEAIEWSFELLTSIEHGFGIDPKRLYVSVFVGDENAPQDAESIGIWKDVFSRVGIQADLGDRIYAYPKSKNWWGPVGGSGPCGPDTEIFYDTHPNGSVESVGGSHDVQVHGSECHINCDCGRFIEIWNNVFMEYNKTKYGKYEPLTQKNVDTGMGLERIAMILQSKPTIFETDLLWPLIAECQSISDVIYETQKHSYRIIADHIRASTFLILDGIVPSNTEHGYVLRRLLRRAIRHAKVLHIKEDWYGKLIKKTGEIYKDAYPEIQKKESEILKVVQGEAEKFAKALENGLGYLKNWSKKISAETTAKHITSEEIGKLAFYMHESYGFPVDDTLDEIKQVCWQFDTAVAKSVAEAEFKKHQEISRIGAEKKFGGHGILQTGEMKAASEDELKKVTKLHTATHLLHQALRKVLGEHIKQTGSDITSERLRFDFTHPQKMTDEEKKKVEDMVNEQIRKSLPVKVQEMSYDEALKSGALAFFKEKYQDKVKVYSIGEGGSVFSKEFCGGPHVTNIKELGSFKILKEESSSAGVRRIRATVKE